MSKSDILKKDEKEWVELSFLHQIKGLGWETIELTKSQVPNQSYRESFSDIVLKPKLKIALKEINSWLEDDQIESIVSELTTFSSNSLIANNKEIYNYIQDGIIVEQNRQTGEVNPTAKIIDFKDSSKNNYVAISQLKLKVKAKDNYIEPDLVCYLNGLPIVVIEAKSPKDQSPIPHAISDLLDYSEQTHSKKNGNKELFYYNQFVIATCRNIAKFGSITTAHEKHFYKWLDPYPFTLEEIEHGKASPTEQQRIVAGMLSKENLLKIIDNYILFSTDEKDRVIKVVGRYQQFRAVEVINKRLLTGKNAKERSGIIWHTQGSGKSLTMMFTVRAMYKIPELSKWKVIFLTDRTQLEEQLTTTSKSIGYKVKVANNIKKLKELISNSNSDLVMAMIHKFQERDLNEIFPELNSSANILIMIDEAHRSQYKLLGANLDKALPNATKIAYTGTPIDKTEMSFGDYIDKPYTMREAIADGVTLEIVYEGRTYNAEIDDKEALDKEFADVFSENNLEERLKILGYGSKRAYLEAKETIKAKAKDMVQHYVNQVFPNGFKAQVVAVSQEAAVRYKDAIDEALSDYVKELENSNPNHIDIQLLKQISSQVVVSGNGEEHINKYSDSATHKKIIEGFKKPFGSEQQYSNVGFIIVNSMLLTGFDAPIEQVMYLDKTIKGANLLQTLARVNRVGSENKQVGFIVDYVGIGHHLKEAIESYDKREEKIDAALVSDITSSFKNFDEYINELKLKVKEMDDFVASLGVEDLNDYDLFFDLFYDDEIRFEFTMKYKALAKALDNVLPKKEALEYIHDFNRYSEIYVEVKSHTRDNQMSFSGIPAKLRTLTDAYLKAKGIDTKIKPISILDEKFEDEIGKKKRSKTKATATEHAIREHININIDEDPELYASFNEMLEEILKNNANNWEEIYKELEKLRAKMKKDDEPTYGLNKKAQMPLFRILKKAIYEDKELSEDDISHLVALTKEVFTAIKTEISLKDFWSNPSAQIRLKGRLQKDILLSEEFYKLPNITTEYKNIISKLIEFASVNSETIILAEL